MAYKSNKKSEISTISFNNYNLILIHLIMPASIIGSFLSFLITGIYSFYFLDFPMDLNRDIKILLLFAIIMNALYFFYFESYTEVHEDYKKQLREKVGMREWYIRILNQTILFSLWFPFQIHPLVFSAGLIILYALYIYWSNLTKECYLIKNEEKHRVNEKGNKEQKQEIDRSKKTFSNLFWSDVAGFIISVAFVALSIAYQSQTEQIKKEESARQNNLEQIMSTGTISPLQFESLTSPRPMKAVDKRQSINTWWSICLIFYILIPGIGIYFTKGEMFDKKYWIRKGVA